jgi:hypothetical protein
MPTTTKPTAVLVRSNDREALMRSASGGAFWELALLTLESGGAVCGCAWDEGLVARHIIVNDNNDLKKLQGSKYVRSDLGDCISECLEIARSGQKVLFSGTPCQCNAICISADSALPPEYRDNLTVVAIICHGTARPALWDSYRTWLESQYGGERLTDACFRDKSKGYSHSQCRYVFSDSSGATRTVKWSTYLQDRFILTTIVYNLCLEKSCYNCKYKGLDRPFDLIIGDWYEASDGDGALGSSCVISLTDAGERLVSSCFPQASSLDVEEVAEKNHFLVDHVTEPENNARLCAELESTGKFPNVEAYFPKKYKLKKALVKVGLFDTVKRVIGK